MARRTKSVLLDLADAIAGPRPAVVSAFAAVAGSRQDPAAFEAIAAGARSERDAYIAALTYAEAQGWLPDLVHSLLEVQATKGDFVAHARKALPSDLYIADLHAAQEAGDAAFQPDVLCALLGTAPRSVCRIDIDGKPAGTGCLVAPSLVLTGHHVVAPLLKSGLDLKATAAQLSIVFDDRVVIVNGIKRRLSSKAEAVADDWLADSSECPPQELLGTSYEDQAYLKALDASAGPWDFALLRLRRPPDALRSPLRPHDLTVQVDDPILVLHHSRGQSMALTVGRIRRLTDTRTRFFHSVWTEKGASGGPCLGAEGRLVGIHQAGPQNLSAGVTRPPNRAIPILPLVRRLEEAISREPAEPARMTNLAGNGHPVLGRDQLQDWLWRAASEGLASGGAFKPILLALSSRPGRGARFTEAILRSRLTVDRHLVVFRDAANFIAMTPGELAADLVNAATGKGTVLPVNENDSAENNWIRKTLVPDTLRAIGASRGNRLVWFVFRFPPGLELPDKTGIRETLDAFYAEVATHQSWARLVLLSPVAILPQSLTLLAEIERLRPIDPEEVVAYIERRWTTSGVVRDRQFLSALIQDKIELLDPDADTYQGNVAEVARWLDGLYAQMLARESS